MAEYPVCGMNLDEKKAVGIVSDIGISVAIKLASDYPARLTGNSHFAVYFSGAFSNCAL